MEARVGSAVRDDIVASTDGSYMAISQIQNRSRGPSQEYLLLDYLQRLGRSLDGRMAVHIHLSRLRPQNRQDHHRSEEHTSELQSLMRISYAGFCLKKKKQQK